MRHSTKDNYLYLTTTPVPRLIVSLAVPTIISMLVTSFYNMADTYFVGKINTQSTAAVGIVFSVMSIIQAVGFFFGHGSGELYFAETRCAGDWECREDGGYRFLLGVVYGYISGSGGTYLPYPVVACIGFYTYYPALYGKISGHHIAGCPFMTASLVLNNQIRFQGNAALCERHSFSG